MDSHTSLLTPPKIAQSYNKKTNYESPYRFLYKKRVTHISVITLALPLGLEPRTP